MKLKARLRRFRKRCGGKQRVASSLNKVEGRVTMANYYMQIASNAVQISARFMDEAWRSIRLVRNLLKLRDKVRALR